MSHVITRWRVRCQRPVAYDIVCTRDLFDPQNPALLSAGRVEGGRRFVVVDSNVDQHRGEEIRAYFAHHGITARIVTFPGGEENKTLRMYLSLLGELDAFPIHRRDEPIIAVGGGVLTDVVGFVASSYRRGVPHIKVPTTLMGYVDASVGVKASINFNGSKNRLGSFEAPQRVFLDKTFLKTLPHRHILNGVCEIIKLAIIKDAELFDQLEQHGVECIAARFQNFEGGGILERAITGMLEELESNLFEENLARKVDFGHTFSYGLETSPDAGLLHGEAVLLDMLVSCLIANQRRLLSEREVERIFGLIERLGIAINPRVLDAELLWQSLLERVEHRNGLQRVPLPESLGNCVFLNDIRRQEIESCIRSLNDRVGKENEAKLEC
ncbi:MAG: sedoheptulose 7-phosphate cyclase [Gammaproteobacteria bacterium]|nr:sedoheptulose 7-phosphate cyclase [Gammaproteobacteria bacterium]